MKKLLTKLCQFSLLLQLMSCGGGSGGGGTNWSKGMSDGNSTIDESAISDALSSFSLSSPSVADGMTPTEVTVTLKRANGQGAKDMPVSIWVSGHQNVLMPCSMTDGNGVSRCRFYSTYAEKKIFKISSPIEMQKEIDFIAPDVSRVVAGIVSSSGNEVSATGYHVVSASGLITDPDVLADSHQKLRVESYIQVIQRQGPINE